MDTLLIILALAAALGCGLISGLLFVFSNFAMRAFRQLGPTNGIAAMQSINAAILNPVFLAIFLGTGLTSLATAVLAVRKWGEAGMPWLLAGSALYLVGAIGITITRNVPLNERLEAVDPDSEEGHAMWEIYLARWLPWNHVRTVATLGGMAAQVVGLILGEIR